MPPPTVLNPSTPLSPDPAVLDRRVPVELPDLAGREAILNVHAKKSKPPTTWTSTQSPVWRREPLGAELANIINEAALRAVRSGRTVVEQADLEESIEVVIAGYQKKNAIMTDEEKKIVSYHEIGHALVAALQTESAPVQKNHHNPPNLRGAGLHHAGRAKRQGAHEQGGAA